MNLYEKLAAVENKIGLMEKKLGLPQRRNLLVRHQTYNTTTKQIDIVDSLILPPPYITSLSPRFANLQVSIEGATNAVYLSILDIQVEIPRIYSKSLFLPSGNTKSSFVIDPPIDISNQIIYSDPSTKALAGFNFHKMIFLLDNNPIVWNLILRGDKDIK